MFPLTKGRLKEVVALTWTNRLRSEANHPIVKQTSLDDNTDDNPGAILSDLPSLSPCRREE